MAGFLRPDVVRQTGRAIAGAGLVEVRVCGGVAANPRDARRCEPGCEKFYLTWRQFEDPANWETPPSRGLYDRAFHLWRCPG